MTNFYYVLGNPISYQDLRPKQLLPFFRPCKTVAPKGTEINWEQFKTAEFYQEKGSTQYYPTLEEANQKHKASTENLGLTEKHSVQPIFVVEQTRTGEFVRHHVIIPFIKHGDKALTPLKYATPITTHQPLVDYLAHAWEASRVRWSSINQATVAVLDAFKEHRQYGMAVPMAEAINFKAMRDKFADNPPPNVAYELIQEKKTLYTGVSQTPELFLLFQFLEKQYEKVPESSRAIVEKPLPQIAMPQTTTFMHSSV